MAVVVIQRETRGFEHRAGSQTLQAQSFCQSLPGHPGSGLDSLSLSFPTG